MQKIDKMVVMDDTKDTQKRVIGKPFVSGDARANPGGRARVREDVFNLGKDATLKAMRRWIEALDAVNKDGDPDHEARGKAGDRIFDRIHGKSPQSVTGEDGKSVLAGIILLPTEE